MVSASDFEVERRDCIVGGGDVGIEIGLGDVFNKSLTSVLCRLSKGFSIQGKDDTQRTCLPWAVKIAAKIGLASSNVRVEREMKA